jgi:exodeoxyribonuclease III
MKIITYNVNGIRSALSKGFATWVAQTGADVLCLQEVKAEAHQIESSLFEDMGYSLYWHSAEKKGYSGVAILTKPKPKLVTIGCGMERYDREGRVLRIDFEETSIMNVYMPSGSSGEERQKFKFEWMDDFLPYAKKVTDEIPHLVICGDYNICHRPIDIHNPKSNAKSSGFLPEEREWMETFFQAGFHDAFRLVNPNPHHYTWWSYRAGARAKNLGWRIDYHAVTDSLKEKVHSVNILSQAMHSDHCPVLLDLK